MQSPDPDALDNTFIGLPLTILTAAGNLAASLHTPLPLSLSLPIPQTTNNALVILLHGLAGTRHEHNGIFMRLAANLASLGFTVLRFDFRGCGESDGTTMDIYPSAQVEDALAVIDFALTHRRATAPTSCHLLGFSLGGVIATLCALQKPELFDSLTIWEAPFDLSRELKRVFGPMSFDRIRARGYMQAGLTKLSPQLFAELTHLDISGRLAEYRGDVLLVSGDQDQLVPLVPNHQEWINAFSAAHREDFIVVGADHGFSGYFQEHSAIQRTGAFLLSQEKKKIPAQNATA